MIIVVSWFFLVSSSEKESDVTSGVFFLLITNPDLYSNGVYTNEYTARQGEYTFRFTPSGSSPETLSITLKGENFDFHEDFKLKGTSHETWNLQEYFTWEYLGEKTVLISEDQEVSVIVNPNGNVMGEYSVGLIYSGIVEK